VRAALAERFGSLKLQQYQEAANFEIKSTVGKAKLDVEEFGNRFANTAMNDGQNVEAIMAQMDQHIAGLPGLTELERQDLRLGQRQKIARAGVQGLVERNPYLARDKLAGGAYDDMLDAEGKGALYNAAQAEISKRESEARRIANEAEAAQQRAESEARSAARHQEAMAKAAQVEARGVARDMLQDELAAAEMGESAYGGETERAVRDAFGDQAPPMLAALDRRRENHAIGAEIGTLTAAEIQATIDSVAPAGGDFAAERVDWAKRVTMAQEVLEERQRDPAAAVAKRYPNIRAGLQSQDPAEVAQAIRSGMNVQQNVFGLAPDQVRPLTKPAADRIVERVKNAQTADEKLAVLEAITTGLRDDTIARTALDQLEAADLPDGMDRALEHWRDGDLAAARRIVTDLSIDPKDRPQLGPDKKADVGRAVDAVFAGENAAGAAARAASILAEPSAAQIVARDRALMQQLAEGFAASGADGATAAQKAYDTVYGDRPVVGAAVLPKGADPELYEQGFDAIAAGLDLSHLAPRREQFPADGMGEQAYNNLSRDWQATVEDIRDGADFVTVPGGYAVVNPVTGQTLKGADGKPLVYNDAELQIRGEQARIEGQRPVNRAGPGRPMGGGSDDISSEAVEQDALIAAVEEVTGRPVLRNPDGSYATMEQITVTDERINNGQPTNIPSIWDGKRLSEDESVERAAAAIASGAFVGHFVDMKAYPSIDAAVEAAKKESAAIEPAALDLLRKRRGSDDISGNAGRDDLSIAGPVIADIHASGIPMSSAQQVSPDAARALRIIDVRGKPSSREREAAMAEFFGRVGDAAPLMIAENLPGAEIAVALRDSLQEGMGIGPALREGRLLDAAKALGAGVLAAMGALPAVPAFGTMVKAWHGTPHSFDKFDSAKIGTGEGVQMYGQGLYFAEGKEVAEHYKKSVKDMGRIGEINKRQSELAREMSKLEKPGRYGEYTEPRGYALKAEYDKLMDEKLGGKGNLYSVELDFDHDDLLDLDKRLDEQSPKVRAALEKMGVDLTPKTAAVARRTMPGRPVPAQTTQTVPLPNALDWYKSQGSNSAQAEMSIKLREAGIPGARYLDAGSRDAADGSRNIVVFDDNRIKITGRE
jgi:hypothetical protein